MARHATRGRIMDDLATAFGSYLNGRLKEKGISKVDFACDLGVTKGAVTNWTAARSIPNIKTLARIADYLDVSIYELIEGEAREERDAEEERLLRAFRSLNRSGRYRLMEEAEIYAKCSLLSLF